MNCSGADSDALAATTIVYSIAPSSSSLVDDLRDGRLLLADGHVDAVHPLALLVDDRVERDGGLAGLAVADDELALAAADGDHRVDGLEARLQRLVHRLALDDAGRLDLDAAAVRGLDGALAVDGLTERVDHAAHQRLAHGHVGDAAGALDLVALLHRGGLAEDRRRRRCLLEVEHQAQELVGELHQLAGHGARQAVDAGDAVADGEHGARLGDLDGLLVVLDLLLDDLGDLFGAELHLAFFLGELEDGAGVASPDGVVAHVVLRAAPGPLVFSASPMFVR
jgi:hypothetical protein